MHYTQLSQIPDLMSLFRKAALDMVPVIGTNRKATNDPTTAFEVTNQNVDVKNLAAYNNLTGQRLSNDLPATYPYVLSFPLATKIMLAPDFPCRAVGMVHINNVISQTRPLTVDDTFDIRVHAENLRPHRKGLLIDFVTEISVDGEVIWKQTSAFLGAGAKFASDAPPKIRTRGEDSGSILERKDLTSLTASAQWKVTPNDIADYAEVSGDKNPIHVSTLGAKAFGFPSTIAHGMWTAARMLGALEGELPGAMRFSVEFNKPVVLPARLAYWSVPSDDNESWDLQVRKSSNPDKVHAVGKIEALH